MKRKRLLSVVAAGMVFSLVAAACSSNKTPSTNSSSSASTGKVVKGGVYRTALEDFGFTGAFDPTGEYLNIGFGLFSEMLLRNLVTYRHVAGLAGDQPVPDLATDTGQVSGDGLTYTFKLKQGVKFAPPVDRVITSHDIEYAFERIDTKSLVAQYGFYYDGTIVGMDGAHSGAPKPISGIETPDDNTIIFHLQQPTGDFLYRLAMPATAAMPKEVAGCFTKAGDYGRDVIASGPYMIQGSDQVDVSSCSAIKPMSGFDPTKKLIMVRNPNYDPATDSTSAREANVDGVSILIDSNTDDIFNKVSAGELDGSYASQPPPQVEQKYATDPSLKGKLHSDPDDVTSYITLNLLVPPFDDIHVRKAVNYALDKAAFLKAYGGPLHGKIATHIFPPSMVNFGGNYDPYPTANFNGDINKAKAEMKQSKYDSNGDGVCDSSVCNNVLMIGRTTPPRVNMDPTIENDLAQIGIKIKTRELDTGTAYTTIQTVKNLVPISNAAAWGKDYADPTTFAVLFQSSGINCEGQINYSEVGMTADQAKECGVEDAFNKVGGNTLSVDDKIDNCNKLSGQDRTNCWIDLDKYLMENVVPWAPYIWPTNLTVLGDSVTKYEFDQFAGLISLCHIAVNNHIDASTLS
jgi:peptide/nickel transport system substrate-binding protein